MTMTEKEKSHAELLYQPNDPELAADRDITQRKLYEYNRLHPLDRDARRAAIREIFGAAGENCCVEQPLFCTYGYNTRVGKNFFLNVNCKIMDSGKVTIGDKDRRIERDAKTQNHEVDEDDVTQRVFALFLFVHTRRNHSNPHAEHCG